MKKENNASDGIMKGTERGPDGKLRYFYQYKVGGPKYYYQKSDNGRLRIPFQRPFIPKYDREQPRQEYREYVPQPPQSKLEIEFNRMHPNVKALISRWLLIFGFQSIKDISTVRKKDVAKAKRQKVVCNTYLTCFLTSDQKQRVKPKLWTCVEDDAEERSTDKRPNQGSKQIDRNTGRTHLNTE
jgi:hypothetical protein